jgi:hypothetical protein
LFKFPTCNRYAAAARAIGAAREAKRKFAMRAAAAARALEAVMERGTADEVEAATAEAERLGAAVGLSLPGVRGCKP